MSKVLRNDTLSDIIIDDTGITIGVGAPNQYTIPPQDYLLWAASSDITTEVTAGNIVVKDSVGDLNATDGNNYLEYTDTAFNERFLSEPERSNTLTKKNVQEAIEEVKDLVFSDSGVLKDIPCLASVAIGEAVRMVSGTAEEAIATSAAGANVMGVVQAKSSSVLCDIRVSGVTSSIFAGLDDTKAYFLSDITAGLLTTTPPTAAGSVIIRVGNPFDGTKMLVNKGIRIKRS